MILQSPHYKTCLETNDALRMPKLFYHFHYLVRASAVLQHNIWIFYIPQAKFSMFWPISARLSALDNTNAGKLMDAPTSRCFKTGNVTKWFSYPLYARNEPRRNWKIKCLIYKRNISFSWTNFHKSASRLIWKPLSTIHQRRPSIIHHVLSTEVSGCFCIRGKNYRQS